MTFTMYSLTAFVVGTLTIATVIGWFVAGHLDKKYGTETPRRKPINQH
jgi:hypothetical protein